MVTLALLAGVPSAPIGFISGQKLTVQVTKGANVELLVEGSMDGGATWKGLAKVSALGVGADIAVDGGGYSLARMTVTGANGSGTTATVNVNPFGLAGLLTSTLPFPLLTNKRYPLMAPRIAFVGDSITSTQQYGPSLADPIDPSLNQSFRPGYGAWTWMGIGYLNGKALFVGVAAKPSSTVVNYAGTPGWTATWLTNALKVKPDVIVFLDGSNDLLYWPNNVTPTGIPTAAQWTAFVQQKILNVRTCLSAGVVPVICSLLPRVVSGGVACPQVLAINAFYKALALQFNIPFVDLYPRFANSDGSIKSGYLMPDNAHPSSLGVQTMAQVFSGTIAGYLGGQTQFATWWNSGDVIGSNMSLIPQFGAVLNTGSPVVVPGGYTPVTGTTSFYTGTYVTDDTGVRSFNMSSVNAPFNDGPWSTQVSAGASTFAVGDLIQLLWKVKFRNPGNDLRYIMNMNIRDQALAATEGFASFNYDTNGQWVTLSKEFKVAGGMTGMSAVQNVDTTAGVGIFNGDMSLGPVSIVNLTKLGMNAW